jgi:acyl carrier protein
METIERLRTLYTERMQIQPDSVTPMTAIDDFNLDPLDRIEFILAVEAAFEISLSGEEASAVTTLQELADRIQMKLSQRRRPSKLAVQMYTVRDFTQTAQGLIESLKKIREIGYEAVQLSAVGAMNGETPEVDAKECRRILDGEGLRCIATHRRWEDLVNRPESEIEFHQILDCDYTAIGGIPGAYGERGEEGYSQFVTDAIPIIERLNEAQLRFGYHNHAHEFQRIGPGRRTLYDILIDEGEPDLLLEIDVYWADHAGVNPVRLFERCPGRVPVIHLKDKEVVPKEGPVMAAIGEGNLDWDEILPACEEAGVDYYAVEQDVCRRDPFDCLRSSYTFLTEYFNTGG